MVNLKVWWSRGGCTVCACLLLFTVGCSSVPKRRPVPEEFSAIAEIPGIPEARVFGDVTPPHFERWKSIKRDEFEARFPGIYGKEHNYLALSGGGPFGAYGAGLLNGWTEHGDRPVFTMVTGISAGALIAPFAFLGPEYDDVLRKVFTESSTEDLIDIRGLFGLIGSDAAADSAPLRELIAKYVDEELLARLAVEYRKGRVLLIGTTNLDAERPVIWNIGKIAASGHEDSLPLVRDVLLASASIAGAFPPVRITAEVNGELFDELHVDGGTVSTVFLYPTGTDWGLISDKLKVKGDPKLYLIQNFFVAPRWREVEPRLLPIATYGMFTIVRNQGIGDIYRVFTYAQRDGIDFNLGHVPDDFSEKPDEIFDPEFMGKLFDAGYQQAKSGYPWKKLPPGMKEN